MAFLKQLLSCTRYCIWIIKFGYLKTFTFNNNLLQLFGRAGRDGCPSRGHLFYSSSKKKSNKKVNEDKTLLKFAHDQENCRRRTLVSGMGGRIDNLVRSERCCDLCTPSAIPCKGRLDVTQAGMPSKRKRRIAVRVITDNLLGSLKQRLCLERSTYIQENPCLRMVGPSFVCPDVTIDEICKQAEYISSVDDISLFGIRTDLKHRFFNIITDVLSQLVPRKRWRRL